MVFVIQNFYWDFLFVRHFKLFNSLVGSSKKAELTSHRLDSSSCLFAVACKPGLFFFVYPDVLRFPARSFRFYFRASGIFNSPSQFFKLRDFSVCSRHQVAWKWYFFGRNQVLCEVVASAFRAEWIFIYHIRALYLGHGNYGLFWLYNPSPLL